MKNNRTSDSAQGVKVKKTSTPFFVPSSFNAPSKEKAERMVSKESKRLRSTRSCSGADAPVRRKRTMPAKTLISPQRPRRLTHKRTATKGIARRSDIEGKRTSTFSRQKRVSPPSKMRANERSRVTEDL